METLYAKRGEIQTQGNDAKTNVKKKKKPFAAQVLL